MNIPILLLLSTGLSGLALAAGAAEAPLPTLMTAPELLSLPSQPADLRIAYGALPEQFGDLRVPAGAGQHPVVILVHGGCWRGDAEFADADHRAFGPIADMLKAQGIASWNIEYRRLFEPGSGWPGTFLDVAQGVDHLRGIAALHSLDLERVVIVGHSAGGHLGHWAAARHRLPPDSELYMERPLRVNGVINLAGTLNMESAVDHMHTACGGPVVEAMNGGMPSAVPAHYSQTSAEVLLPLGIPQVLLWGEYEEFVSHALASTYVEKASAAGDAVHLTIVPGIGHFELATTEAPSWPLLLEAIRSLLEGRLPPE